MKTAFCKTVIGASHISSNKPCQDYSIAEAGTDYSIIIVSDGHGSDTYVRSNVGSRIAATIAKKRTIEFLSTLYSLNELKDVAIFVGPKPNSPLAKAYVHKVVSKATEQQLQDIKYYESVEGIETIDETIRNLFNSIHQEWLKEINEDAFNNPFSEMEKKRLGGNSIVKAYGCTLICCIETKDFYFAYQIGDGKCYISSVENEWAQPIPWDCNCFLNITTSLCIEDRPIANLFRYAFNSKDCLPTVVFIGSDGVDGSYDTEKVLELDYASIVDACVNSSNVSDFEDIDLADFLTKKSQEGSKDDMSLCGIIEHDNIRMWLELNQLKREVYLEETKGSKIKKEIARLEQIISKQQERIRELKKKKNQNDQEKSQTQNIIKKLKEKIEQIKHEIEQKLSIIQKKEDDNKLINQELEPLLQKEKENSEKLKLENERYERWKVDAKESVQNLREQRDAILKKIHKQVSSICDSFDDSHQTSVSKPVELTLNFDELLSRSDEIIFAKMGGSDEDTYSFDVSDERLICDKSGTTIQRVFDKVLFDELKKKLAKVDWHDYPRTNSCGNRYCYVTFLCNGEPIESFFIPINDESIIKPLFWDKLKLDQF